MNSLLKDLEKASQTPEVELYFQILTKIEELEKNISFDMPSLKTAVSFRIEQFGISNEKYLEKINISPQEFENIKIEKIVSLNSLIQLQELGGIPPNVIFNYLKENKKHYKNA